MTTNVNLEFIIKVRELSESMHGLATFWRNNSEMLEGAKVYKKYPFSESFDDLAFNVFDWLLTLIEDYCEKEPTAIFEFFNAYYETLQK